MNLRIIILDDHFIVLDGVCRLIETVPGWQVVAGCTHAREAAKVLRSEPVDVAVVDLRMPEIDGLEFIRRIRPVKPDLAIILLTADISDQDLAEAARLRVNGIVLKEQAPKELLDCIRAVASGDTYCEDQILRTAMERVRAHNAEQDEILDILTQRELEVSRLAAMGLRSREIGAKLSITPGTVKLHLHSVYNKLGISSRVELANFSHRMNLVGS
ncbi:response regulator transcription factor [Sinorhizobium numidicum]|nr:response regulator transcription factor [Sinorhizobium numidicum]WEX75594.1 response regulator transcription factor [Sinorhizobium numidicum]